jgi:hypothetical protein
MRNFIQSIEASLTTENHYAALGMALAAPDVCGWILDPSTPSKQRYIAWFEKYVQDKYTLEETKIQPRRVFLSGSDCYALRCAFLHEGRENISAQRAREVLESFQFVVPPPGWNIHNNKMNNTLQLQVDVFCRDLTEGVQAFLEDISSDSDCVARMNEALLIRDVNGNPI